jgi:CHASE3 domain sensor protein
MRYKLDYHLLLSVSIIAIMMVFIFINNNNLVLSNNRVIYTYEAINFVEQVLNNLIDAETSQRGYLLTGKDEYLEPYKRSIKNIGPLLDSTEKMLIDNPSQTDNIRELNKLVKLKLHELEFSIKVPKSIAIKLVNTDVGKKHMDQIRNKILLIKMTENKVLIDRVNNNYNIAKRCLMFFPSLILVHVVLTNISLGLLFKERRQSYDNS